MGVVLTGVQLFILTSVIVLMPLIGYYLFGRKLSSASNGLIGDESRRSLYKVEQVETEKGVLIRDIDWSLSYSGWLKGQALNFEKEKIPLIATLVGVEQKGAWSQPVKIGANPLIRSTKNYLEKFGKAVITITSVSRDDIARNVTWGLSTYLNSIAGRILVFEICQKNTRKKQTARIDLSERKFNDLPDPKPSEIQNVDIVSFDQPYTWPEDILTNDVILQFVDYYKNTYPLIFIVAPPVLFNGFARKTASCSDCCMLIGSKFDDQSVLIDAYQRIRFSGRESGNDSLVIWGIREKLA